MRRSFQTGRIALLLLAVAFANAGAIAGCGAFGAEEAPNTGAPEAGADGGGGAADGGTNTPPEGGTTGEVVEAPCDPSEKPVATAIYVSEKNGSDDTGDGTAVLPFKTIGLKALNLAKATSATAIVLDEGTYAETVKLDAAGFTKGLSIDGAWSRTGVTWSRDCSKERRDKTLIQSPETIGVRISNAGGTIALSNMTITTKPPAATPPDTTGTSRYGVFADNGAIVSLSNVTVRALPGESGGAASPVALSTTRPCNGVNDCEGSPVAGSDSPAAAPPVPGTFDPTGYLPSNGIVGLKGGDGDNGTDGGAPNKGMSCASGCGNNSDNCNGGVVTAETVSSSPGKCGCGGAGGLAGKQGLGGGASVAAFATGAGTTISVRYSDLVASVGGDGSPGGAGSGGGAPSLGTTGQNAQCYTNQFCRIGTCPSCGCYCKGSWDVGCGGSAPTPVVVQGGNAGGAGKPGGKGADASGGAGGPSFTYVPHGGAQIVVTDSRRTFGAGGAGGGGSPPGAAGEKP